MRVFTQDFAHLRSALAFMAVVAHKPEEKAHWCALESLAERVEAKSEELQEQGQEYRLEHSDFFSELQAASVDLEHAMSCYWRSWSDLARQSMSRKGKLPPMVEEESGNAYHIAAEIREAAQFLHAALSLEPVGTKG